MPSLSLSLSLHWPRVAMPSISPSLLFLLAVAVAVTATSSETTSAACKSSCYPKLCRALLSPAKLPSGPYDYGRYSVKQALKQAKRTAKIIDRYLTKGGGHRRGSNIRSTGALDDCRQLADLNADFLIAVQAELGPRDAVLGRARVDRVKALMSAVVTNQQTCFDGLEASRSFPELYGMFENETKMYGVSLELVTSAVDRNGGGSVGPAGSVSG